MAASLPNLTDDKRRQQQQQQQLDPSNTTSEKGHVSNRGVTAPILNIEPWIERAIQIFTAVFSTILIARLRPLGSDSSVLILFILMIVMFLCVRLKSAVDHFCEKYAPKEFGSAAITIMKLLEFITIVSIFVVSSYSVVLLGGWWVGGHLTFGEAFVSIILVVGFIYAIAVVHHDVRTAIDRLRVEEERRAADLLQRQQQQQQFASGGSVSRPLVKTYTGASPSIIV